MYLITFQRTVAASLLLLLCHFACAAVKEDHHTSSFRCVQNTDATTLKNFTDAQLFLDEYVQKMKPILFEVAMNEESLKDYLDVKKLIDLPHALTIYVDVRVDGVLSSNPMSIRQVLQNGPNKDIIVNTPIPSVLKAVLTFPAFMECEPIMKNLLKTKLMYSSKQKSENPMRNEADFLICQIIGQSQILILTTPENNVSDNVDLTKKDESVCYEASLSSKDCLYLPTGWSYKMNNSDSNLMIQISWSRPGSESKLCGNVSDSSLLSVVFAEDPPMDLISFFDFGDFHHVLQTYFLRNSEENILTSNVFSSLFKAEKKITKRNWTEEHSALATEMFVALDINEDGKLSLDDFDNINQQDLKNLSTRIEQIYAKLKGEEKEKSGMEILTELTRNLMVDMEGKLENMVKDEFTKLFQEIEEVEKEIDSREQGKKQISTEEIGEKKNAGNDENEKIILKSGKDEL